MSGKSVTKLIREASESCVEFALWPDKPVRQENAEEAVKELRMAIRGYDPAIVDATLKHVLGEFWSEARIRNAKIDGLKKAWTLLAELIV